MRKRILSTLLALCMVLGMLPGTAWAAGTTSGECGADGSNVTWNFYENTGTLIISGNGAMADYDNNYQTTNYAPWSPRVNEDLGYSITKVIIEPGVTTIGDFAFSSCLYIEQVDVPTTVISIGQYAFSSCIALRGIDIPDSVNVIKPGAFDDCRELRSIAIPEGVTKIESATFFSCSKLNNVVMPSSVAEIGSQAFQNCESLSVFPLTTHISRIETGAFEGCNNVTALTIPDGVTYIGNNAFANCKKLQTVEIPASVEVIGTAELEDWADAFHSCASLTSITVDSANSKFASENGILYNKEKTILLCYPAGKPSDSYLISDSVVRIGAYAFSGCESLQEILMPDSVTSIDFMAFAGCLELTSMTFPASVRSISSNAFGFYWDFGEKDWGITDLYFEGDAPNIGDGEHSGASFPSDVTLYYRSGASGWTTPTWKGYKTEIWEGDDTPGPDLPPIPVDGHIINLSPENGTTNVGYDASDPPEFCVTFDREINTPDGDGQADVNLTYEGAFMIRRTSDDQLMWQSGKYTDSHFTVTATGNTLVIEPTNRHSLLAPNTQYYITMDERFVRFTDGTGSPAIPKGEWSFTTADIKCFEPLVKHGYFEFTSDAVESANGNIKYSYDYDETWFFNSSNKYQHDLVKMSIRAALAAYGAEGTKSTSKNIEALMQDLNYSNIIATYPTPEKTSIGYAIGSKNIISDTGEKCALIMVAVRGGAYFDEWGGNFLLGNDEEHYGFSIAADSVLNGIQEYINTHKQKLQSNLKIWIVGYSRGAATANIVAKNLDDNKISGVSARNVYAFCFECPQNTRGVNSTKYNNITNIVNPIDLIPKVAMSAWEYTRYGRTYYTPYRAGLIDSEYSVLRDRMKEQYELIVGPYNVNPDNLIPGEMSELILETDIIPDFLAYELANPEVYSIAVQDWIVDIMIDTFGAASALSEEQKMAKLSSSLFEFLGLDALGSSAMAAVKGFLFKSHYGELCLSWIDSLEGDYSYTDPKYRILFVNCPVDVEVYDNTNSLVGYISNDITKEIEHGVFSFVDTDGQKIIILPNNMEYSIKLIATDDGEVTYTATEYNMDTGNTERVVSYFQVEVKSGDTLVGTAENLEEVASASYPLSLNDAEEITPSVDQSGSTVVEYDITVLATGNGKVFGSGKYVNGKFAKVTATADKGETFLGWYIGNTLVSSEAEYRFLVDKNISLIAKFTETVASPETPVTPTPSYPSISGPSGNSSPSNTATPAYSITLPSVAGGKVTATPASAIKGTTVTLTATPDEGYELVSLTVTDSKGTELELADKGNGKCAFTMPGNAVTISAVFRPIEDQPTTPVTTDWVNPFTDVATTAWYYDAVKFVSENGLMNGIGSTIFAPDANLTRAQLAQIIYNKEGKPAVKSASSFTDVTADDWYAPAVAWAAANNIVGGYGNGQFGPNDNITREQLSVMLWRYAGEPTANSDLAFGDTSQISDFAQDAIRWAVENKILNGKGNNILDPKGFATRAEVAQMLKNYLDN